MTEHAKKLSVTEAANFSFRTGQAVRKAIKEGRLKAEKIGCQWVINRADLADWIGRRSHDRTR